MSIQSPLQQSRIISDLAEEDVEEASRRLITGIIDRQEVMDEQKLIEEILPIPLSDLWGVSREKVISSLKESLQEVVEMMVLEAIEIGENLDFERGVEMIYENASDRFADEVIRNLRTI